VRTRRERESAVGRKAPFRYRLRGLVDGAIEVCFGFHCSIRKQYLAQEA
jgi:hypothetical protein